MLEVKQKESIELCKKKVTIVSILVMLEVKQKEEKTTLKKLLRRVSILVMLEVKQKEHINDLGIGYNYRFNPCYAGSKIESPIRYILPPSDASFNPCYAGSKIESLFTVSDLLYRTVVSILVMLEVKQKAVENLKKGGRFTFQSLLCWK